MKKRIISFLIVAVFLTVTGCAGTNQEQQTSEPQEEKEPTQETIRVASWSQPITEQTNLLVDEDKKFFSEHGLDMEFIPGAGGGDAIKNILSGQADIAFTDPGSLLFALDKGAKLKVIYNIYPQNVFNVVSLKEKNITKPEDLKGKTIGVYSLSSGTRQNLLVLLHQAGLTENDVEIVETGLLNFAPLMQGQVDATAATDTGLLMAKEKGLGDVNVINVKDSLNIPSDVFVVTEEVFNEKKDLLQTFLEAYQNSAEWMINEPEEAASLAVEYAIDGKEEKRNFEIIQLRNLSSQSELTKEKGLGALDAEIFQQAADTYHSLGLIENTLNISEVVVEDFVPNKQ